MAGTAPVAPKVKAWTAAVTWRTRRHGSVASILAFPGASRSAWNSAEALVYRRRGDRIGCDVAEEDNMWRSNSIKLLIAAAMLCPVAARAQTYPSRPIMMVVPYAAGGTFDVMGRI